ncbi:hypothetical protein DEU32_1213 [Curtobacterium sp. AG1037]|nr:hypothetical protein DEU32_1213 [Curtobacterium sp. AG1037]TQJ29260.1 hypothetical protein FB462_3173 [Curtobacterium citreum]
MRLRQQRRNRILRSMRVHRRDGAGGVGSRSSRFLLEVERDPGSPVGEWLVPELSTRSADVRGNQYRGRVVRRRS